MKRFLLVVSAILIFIVISMGFIYPGVISSLTMVIMMLVLGLSVFVIGPERHGEEE